MTSVDRQDPAAETPDLGACRPVSESLSSAAGVKAASQPGRDGKKKKKRDKVRAAWIAFVGRIVAQFVGAAATIVLGLLLLQKYQAPAGRSVTGLAAPPAAAREVQAAETGARPTPAGTSLAVLPFENFSADPKLDYLADAMTEELIAVLAGLDDLEVASRTSAMLYKGQHRMLPDVARELGVDHIVEGSITLVDGRARIVAQLIDGRTDRHLWARSYDRPFRDMLAVQTDVCARIAAEIDAVLSPRGDGPLAPQRSGTRVTSDRSLGSDRPVALPTAAGVESAIR